MKKDMTEVDVGLVRKLAELRNYVTLNTNTDVKMTFMLRRADTGKVVCFVDDGDRESLEKIIPDVTAHTSPGVRNCEIVDGIIIFKERTQ